MSVLDEVLAANDAYASDFGDKGEPGACRPRAASRS